MAYLIRPYLKGLPKSIHEEENPKVLEKKIDSKLSWYQTQSRVLIKVSFRTS